MPNPSLDDSEYLRDLLPENWSTDYAESRTIGGPEEAMRKSKFTEQQISYALSQAEAGVPIAELCRKYGISEQTFYRWRAKYGSLTPSEMRRLKELEDETRRLKRIVADLSLDKQILQDALRKKA